MKTQGHWTQTATGYDCDDWESDAWQCSECAALWVLSCDTPKEHEMHYCSKCGTRMTTQKRWRWDSDKEEYVEVVEDMEENTQ